ncbi:MAG TPA: hypothetical protein VEV81_04415, partial [Pyrinomonadaceae bacterium]|nr:hypothetical protein [Pyrinomonadaceae bacterium]
DPPDVAVLQKSWRSEVRYPRVEAALSNTSDDVFRPNDEHNEDVRAQKEANRINNARVKQGETVLVRASPQRLPPPSDTTPVTFYIYSLKVRNNGEKTIRSIVWEYIFVDPETLDEVGHHRSLAKVKIGSGKTENLVERSDAPPIGVVDVGKAGKDARNRYTERIVIQRIEYSDGTFWQRPLN